MAGDERPGINAKTGETYEFSGNAKLYKPRQRGGNKDVTEDVWQ
jgi:hypothetical protein